MWKKCTRCGAKHISKSKCTKHTRFEALLADEMSKKCAPLWRDAHFQVKTYKILHVRSTFGSSDIDIEKVHALVAQSTFPSQNVKSTTCSEHFWRLRCRCGATRVSKSKCTKHSMLGAFLEVHISDVEKVHAVVA